MITPVSSIIDKLLHFVKYIQNQVHFIIIGLVWAYVTVAAQAHTRCEVFVCKFVLAGEILTD